MISAGQFLIYCIQKYSQTISRPIGITAETARPSATQIKPARVAYANRSIRVKRTFAVAGAAISRPTANTAETAQSGATQISIAMAESAKTTARRPTNTPTKTTATACDAKMVSG